MRLKTLSAALGVAHFATCAPLPVIVRGQLDVVSADGSHGTVTLLQLQSGLPSLTKHRSPKPVPPTAYQVVDEDQPIDPPQELDDENPYEMLDSESLSFFANPGIPYQQGKVTPREINDMHVVILAASFLGVVIVVEAWNSYKRRRLVRERLILHDTLDRQTWLTLGCHRQGVIRLEDTDEKRRLP
ncbi:hypothetical protein QBC42DRAFT_275231 [Cladorrhinum samala]|uniref:Uncharacterized protein n=1 Tax=Cladorrhinum samala TaxID=585594 RepID=A0AAV9HF17_9PEZI|nr:hypothetical protein QBC42DRAFT_275231 [Cladorrhinum samala]